MLRCYGLHRFLIEVGDASGQPQLSQVGRERSMMDLSALGKLGARNGISWSRVQADAATAAQNQSQVYRDGTAGRGREIMMADYEFCSSKAYTDRLVTYF